MSHAETMTACRHEECEKQGKREEESAEGKNGKRHKKMIFDTQSEKILSLY